MKKIFKHFGVFLSVALMGAFTACNILDPASELTEGLGIKVFFPTKVVSGQPMTINGTGFTDVREIVFPDGVSVTDFEIVSNDMIRVTAPAGIAASGGKILVRTLDEEAESRLPLTLGKTVVSGFSKQEGEEIEGGEQLTIYGQDLEFISKIELLDADGNPMFIDELGFYRKGDGMVVITIPKKIFDGTFVGKVYTYDGREFLLPELTYKPASDGGHWETVKTIIWENDGSHGSINWSGDYRFAGEGFETGEEIAVIPVDVWAKMKTEPFCMMYRPDGDSYQIRTTTGWWGAQWLGKDNDIAPWNMAERIIDNGDGTFYIVVDFSEDPEILETIDAQHLLFTGAGYTPLQLYFSEDIWVDGGGHWEIVKTSVWQNDGSHGAINWSGDYRFAGEGFGTGEEIAVIPADVWAKMKTEPFCMSYRPEGDSYQIRTTTGWWGAQWLGKDNDIAPWNMAERIIDNGDGTFYIVVDFSEDPEILETIDAQHLLFTGSGYTPLEIYFQEEIWVDGGGESAKEVLIWENDGSHGAINWSGDYRFAGEGFGTGEEIAVIPADAWAKIKTQPFYMSYRPDGDSYQIRTTTGWWGAQWLGKDNDIAPWNMAERIIDNGDGTYHIVVDFSEDPEILDTIDAQHLLFTGAGYTPLKLYFLE